MPDEQKRFHFEPVLTIGQLLTAVTIAVGGAGVVYAMRSDLNVIDTRVAALRDQVQHLATTVERLAAITIETARQDERLRNLEIRVQRIERTNEAVR